MLSAKPWKVESVLGLMFGLFLCISTGMLLVAFLSPKGADGAAAPTDFLGFAIGMLCFHGAALALINGFLRHHEVSWPMLLGWRSPRRLPAVRQGVLLGIAAVPVALGLGQLCGWAMQAVQLQPEAQETIRVLERTIQPLQRALFGALAILLAPLVEETLFRGILYPVAKQSGYPRLALWGTSLVFAAIHANLVTVVPLLLLSVALTLLYERTDVLLAPICAHAAFNLVNFVMFVLVGDLERLLPRTP